MNEQPLLILADTCRQACLYAREHDLGREGQRWIHVREPHKILGRREGEYVLLTIPGHHRSFQDIQRRIEMLDILHTHGFRPRRSA